MTLLIAATRILNQMIEFVEETENDNYSVKISELSNGSFGQHVRHVIEFFQCLVQGAESGVINYDRRNRSRLLEESKEHALVCLRELVQSIGTIELSKEMKMMFSYELEETEASSVQTNVGRELAYNIEHSIHHMAILKIGSSIIDPEKKLPLDFGIAASTIRYQKHHVHSNVPSGE